MSQKTTLPHGRNYSYSADLCSSCDRCRTKKVKCDGNRPCEACKISHMRKNKIASIRDAELIRIECVYSPAKKRGPPPKRMNDTDTENEGHVQDKKQRIHSEEQRTDMGQVSRAREMPSTVNHNNINAASILNLLGMMNPAASTSTLGFLQNHQAGNPLYSPIDPLLSAALQQSVLSSLGSTLGIQAMTMDQGLGRVASASRGQGIMSNAPSTATQQLAYLQQLLQQFELQQFVQQQLRLTPTEQGQTRAESSMSSAAVEDERTQSLSLQSEVERLRRRVNELEAENVSLKHKITLLLQTKERENKN